MRPKEMLKNLNLPWLKRKNLKVRPEEMLLSLKRPPSTFLVITKNLLLINNRRTT